MRGEFLLNKSLPAKYPAVWPFSKNSYHLEMFRVLLLAVMIVLMPIRGFIGDAMAIGMQSHSSSETTAHQSARVDKNKLLECHEHAGSVSVQKSHIKVTSVEKQNSGGCSNCSLCDVCHSVAFTLSGMQDALDVMSSLHPQDGKSAYLSAERATSLKPPIS